jgi:hypothetical protein
MYDVVQLVILRCPVATVFLGIYRNTSAYKWRSWQEGKGQLRNHNTAGKEPEATFKKTGVVDFQHALANRLLLYTNMAATPQGPLN